MYPCGPAGHEQANVALHAPSSLDLFNGRGVPCRGWAIRYICHSSHAAHAMLNKQLDPIERLPMSRLSIASVLFASMLMLPVQAQQAGSPTVLSVGGIPVTKAEFEAIYKKNNKEPQVTREAL